MLELIKSFFSPKIDTQSLMELCRRLSTSLRAGVDARSNWNREANNARGWAKSRMETIRDAVNSGHSMSDGLQNTGEYFPVLFRELVQVGEHTGLLAEVLQQLAGHYEHKISLKRAFRAQIIWPLVQMFIAIMVVGLLIWIGEVLPKSPDGKMNDILGFGLVGTDGLIKYLSFLGVVLVAGFVIARQIARGAWWGASAQRLAMQIPKVGGALQSLALSQFCWTLRLTLDTDMPIRRALELGFNSTHNAYYTRHLPDVLSQIRQGDTIVDALARTTAFPGDFLNAVQVGEQSGRLPETLAVISDDYQQQARRAMQTLTMVAAGVVWMLVAGLIIMLIFRLFSNYLGMINGALDDAQRGRLSH